MSKEWGCICRRKIDSGLPIWGFVQVVGSEAEGHARISQLQIDDPTYEYQAKEYLEPPPTCRRKIFPEMTVGQVIEALKAFDPSLKAVIPRSEGGYEGVIACHLQTICEGNVVATYETLQEWTLPESVDPKTAQQAVVIDMEVKIF